MNKRVYAVVAIILVLVVIVAILNGDRLYDALLRMHGGNPHR